MLVQKTWMDDPGLSEADLLLSSTASSVASLAVRSGMRPAQRAAPVAAISAAPPVPARDALLSRVPLVSPAIQFRLSPQRERLLGGAGLELLHCSASFVAKLAPCANDGQPGQSSRLLAPGIEE